MIIIIQLYEQLFNNNNNEKFEILWELQKCDRHKVSKCCWKNTKRCALKSCKKPSICKKQKTQYLQRAIKWDMPVHPGHPNSRILWNDLKSGYWHWCSWCMVTENSRL